MNSSDTIAAIATAPGKGGVGIVRISGPKSKAIGSAMCSDIRFSPRYAYYTSFVDNSGDIIDEGITVFFPGPNSFTGEDVLELQGHGGPVVLDMLLSRCLQLGARLANPGEFSERAFLNDKLDLTQAEAVADLIDASSAQAARNAVNSLRGVFSRSVHALTDDLTKLRIYVEAAIDFPEEEIDFLADGKIAADLQNLINQLDDITQAAQQGALQTEGMNVVIAGKPNAGKSSLLNALAGNDSAIVTSIAGTTRDVLREHININGMPLHVIDTAGIRDSDDEVEQLGIERAKKEIVKADRVLWVIDSTTVSDSQISTLNTADLLEELQHLGAETAETLLGRVTIVLNKCDLAGHPAQLIDTDTLTLSAMTGDGIELLRRHLMEAVGYRATNEGGFTARRRHLDALARAQQSLLTGSHQLQALCAGELLAEDLRQAQQALGEITGEITPDDLLGKIFSSFCIGK